MLSRSRLAPRRAPPGAARLIWSAPSLRLRDARRRVAWSAAPPRRRRSAIWPEPSRGLPEALGELVRSGRRRPAGRPAAGPVPAADAAQAALEPRELRPAGHDLARDLPQHGRPLEQRSRAQHGVDAGEPRDALLEALKDAQALGRRDRAVGVEDDLVTASTSRRRGPARTPRSSCASALSGGRLATFGGPVSSASAGADSTSSGSSTKKAATPGLRSARSDSRTHGLLAAAEPELPAVDVRARAGRDPPASRTARPGRPARVATTTPIVADTSSAPGAISSAPSMPTASAVPANRTVRPARAIDSSTAVGDVLPAASSSRKRDTISSE